MWLSVWKSTNPVDSYASYQARQVGVLSLFGSPPWCVHEDFEVVEDEALVYEQKPEKHPCKQWLTGQELYMWPVDSVLNGPYQGKSTVFWSFEMKCQHVNKIRGR